MMSEYEIFFRYDKVQDWGNGSCWYHLVKGCKAKGIWYDCDAWCLWNGKKGFIGECYLDFDKKKAVWGKNKAGMIGGLLVSNGDICEGKYGVKEYIEWLLGE